MKKYIIIITAILSIFLLSCSLAYFFIKPEVSLYGEQELTINLGDSYNEKGIKIKVMGKAVQEKYELKGFIDKDKVGTYELEYIVNLPYLYHKATIKRVINVIDGEAPVINLTGGNINIFIGDKYIEPGYIAKDSYDGNITDKVIVTNNINNTLAGTYTIEYKVSDSSGNTTIERRSVIVKEKPTTTTTQKISTTKKINKSSKGVAILMYHYFYDKNKETGKNSNYMEIHAFENQMKYLSDNNYYFPSWQEIADYVDGKINLPAKSIVVTVDDGEHSFFELAIPILNKYNIKATAFIITSKAGGAKVKKYQYPNINYQSHTHTLHQGGCTGGRGGLFRCIEHNKGVEDLKKSVEIVGSNDAIAYPFGDVTDNVLSITKDAGFKVGVTIKHGKAKPGMDRYQRPRIRMYKGMSLSSFKYYI